MQNRPINDHDHDSRSCICRKYAEKCRIYVRRIFRQIPHIFLHILPQKVPCILGKFSATNQHPYLAVPVEDFSLYFSLI